MVTRATTSERILDAAADLFGTRGYGATPLDAVAAASGVTKQTVLYWFPSKEALLDAVLVRVGEDLAEAFDAALAGAGPGYARVEAVLAAVFRFGVRRPALLGLVREVSRLPPPLGRALLDRMVPLVERAVAFLEAEMAAGTLRPADPRLVLLFTYTCIVGVATEVEAQRVVGVESSVAGLRRVRRELFAFLRAALGGLPVAPGPAGYGARP